MASEVERLAVIETRQEYLIDMMEGHIEAGCSGSDCKLNDRVLVMEGSIKTFKKVFGTIAAVVTSVTLREHWLPVMAKIRDVF